MYVVGMFFGISLILGILDGIIFLTMDREVFDRKYNRAPRWERGDSDFDRRRHDLRRRRRSHQRQDRHIPHREDRRRRPSQEYSSKRSRDSRQNRVRRPKNNPFKLAGIKKFKEYDMEGAIADFQQALKVDSTDISIYFNLACAYSQVENVELAFEHMSRAVELGFNDFEKIDTHDALAYMRIQPQWESFKTNGYRLRKELSSPKENLLDNDLLLEQLKKLNELKERGLITEDEFIEQKTKLTRQ